MFQTDFPPFFHSGPLALSIRELEPALQFCNYLVYSYAAIDAETFRLKPHSEHVPHDLGQHKRITGLREFFPHLRILLSVGGDQDLDAEGVPDTAKYLQLLEQPESRNNFKSSASAELTMYGFDGLDLAWQFPKLRPKQKLLRRVWSSFKSFFSSSSIDDKEEEHKQQFSLFVRELRLELQSHGKMLTLSMLPHVDPEREYDRRRTFFS